MRIQRNSLIPDRHGISDAMLRPPIRPASQEFREENKLSIRLPAVQVFGSSTTSIIAASDASGSIVVELLGLVGPAFVGGSTTGAGGCGLDTTGCGVSTGSGGLMTLVGGLIAAGGEVITAGVETAGAFGGTSGVTTVGTGSLPRSVNNDWSNNEPALATAAFASFAAGAFVEFVDGALGVVPDDAVGRDEGEGVGTTGDEGLAATTGAGVCAAGTCTAGVCAAGTSAPCAGDCAMALSKSANSRLESAGSSSP